MDSRKVVRDFYHVFEKLDLKGLLPFFAPHAMVSSPTLGKKEAAPFYRELFSKTKRFKVMIKELFVNPDNPHRIAAFVNFTWETKESEVMVFEGVVIYEITPQGLIQNIEIIYDAQRARDAWKKAG